MEVDNSILNAEFFRQEALGLTQTLLGCELVHETSEGVTSGIIVETEAYTQDDPASHSHRGITERNKVMFGPGGFAYIYFTYGMHYCFNVVSGREGHGEGVLIRALEPVKGIDIMRQRRGQNDVRNLCSGPAKLVQAMGITKSDYGKPLDGGNLYIINRQDVPKIQTGKRIGITKEVDKPWRFWIEDNPHVSK